MNIMIYIIMFISSALDIKHKIVFTPLNMLILVISLINHLKNNINILDIILGITLIPLILVFINLFKKDSVGDGDIEYLSALGFCFGYKKEVYAFFICMLTLFIYSLIIKKDKYALIPFISIGFIIALSI